MQLSSYLMIVVLIGSGFILLKQLIIYQKAESRHERREQKKFKKQTAYNKKQSRVWNDLGLPHQVIFDLESGIRMNSDLIEPEDYVS